MELFAKDVFRQFEFLLRVILVDDRFQLLLMLRQVNIQVEIAIDLVHRSQLLHVRVVSLANVFVAERAETRRYLDHTPGGVLLGAAELDAGWELLLRNVLKLGGVLIEPRDLHLLLLDDLVHLLTAHCFEHVLVAAFVDVRDLERTDLGDGLGSLLGAGFFGGSLARFTLFLGVGDFLWQRVVRLI